MDMIILQNLEKLILQMEYLFHLRVKKQGRIEFIDNKDLIRFKKSFD